MKSIFHKETKPLSSFTDGHLINIEDDYLGLYIHGVVCKNDIPEGWFLYYVKSGGESLEIRHDIPIRHCVGTLLLAHELLNTTDKKKTLHKSDYCVIELVDIARYIGMEPPNQNENLKYHDMCDYGYKWDGMMPISAKTGKEFFNHVPIYNLCADNSESLIDKIEDIISQGFYGIEKPDWYHYLCRLDEEKVGE